MRRTRNQNLRSSAVVHGKKYFFSNSDEAAAIEAVANATPDIPAASIFDNNITIGNTTIDRGGDVPLDGVTQFTTKNVTGMPGGALNGMGHPVSAARVTEDMGGVTPADGEYNVMANGANNNFGPIIGFNVNRFFTVYPAHGSFDTTSENYFSNGNVGQLLVKGVAIVFQAGNQPALPGVQWVQTSAGQRTMVSPWDNWGNGFGQPAGTIDGVYGTTIRRVTAEDWAAYPYFTEDEKGSVPSNLEFYHLVQLDVAALNAAWTKNSLYVSPTT